MGLGDSAVVRSRTSQVAPPMISSSFEPSVLSNERSGYDSVLATINDAIDTDNWLKPGGTNTIEGLPPNIVACTAEDIFGSRQAYLKMFDVPTREAAAESNPLEGMAGDDPFDSAVDQ